MQQMKLDIYIFLFWGDNKAWYFIWISYIFQKGDDIIKKLYIGQ